MIYRLAAILSGVAFPISAAAGTGRRPWTPPRTLPDGRTVGIVRRGHTSDRSPFANRMWKLRHGPRAAAVLVLMPDAVRLRHSRRMLDGFPVPVLLALSRAMRLLPRPATRCGAPRP